MKELSLVLLMALGSIVVKSQDTIRHESGVKYVEIETGMGEAPVDGNQVKVMYVGKLLNGKVFDQSIDPFKYTLGDKGIIPGLNIGIAMMREGGSGVLIIPAALGYGAKGAKNEDDPSQYDIPPDSDLIFEIELLKVK